MASPNGWLSYVPVKASGDEVSMCNGGKPLILGGSDGIVLPLGGKFEADLPDWLQAIFYLVGLLWCFMGVAIIADVFMGAIETITSKKVLKVNAKTQKKTTVKVWNDTVANLTLMALGSSAPEILLSIIELLANNMYSGALGPSTIVGSAAFNLMVISAVCVVAIPDGEVRLIKDTGVFAITAFFSVFAYIWLLIILMATTPDVVDIPEGIISFLLFPLLVVLAYLADIGYLEKLSKHLPGRSQALVFSPDSSPDELAKMAAAVRGKYGEVEEDDMAALMAYEFPPVKSRAAYRVNATRNLFGGKRVQAAMVNNDEKIEEKLNRYSNSSDNAVKPDDASVATMQFKSTHFSVKENVGLVKLTVVRTGKLDCECSVNYKTRIGTASADTDFVVKKGTLCFEPNEASKEISIQVVADQTTEKTEDFFVDLSAPDAGVIGKNNVATVVILDSDNPGTLSFAQEQLEIPESYEVTTVDVVVKRNGGGFGKVSCRYYTEDGSAIAEKDYVPVEGTVEFEEGQMTGTFQVKIQPMGRYEDTESFRVVLADPVAAKFDSGTDGGSDTCILTIFIVANPANKSSVDAAMKYLNVNWDNVSLGHARWKEQFTAALYVGGSKEEQQGASCLDWVTHIISMPWKLLFAIVPPTNFAGGWVCFCVALIMIGIVTAIIGDMANLLGCALGVSGSTTAITFVALGTSLPDTFASKSAAMGDPYADASIGNVTGSNSVNVFLGLGMPWLIGAIYWQMVGAEPDDEWYQKGEEMAWPLHVKSSFSKGAFVVPAGGLGPSVAIFTACALATLATLLVRRRVIGGELGGPKKTQWATFAFFVFLWAIYIVASILME
eukprot:TRINITY_DN3262_c0_g2_i2.p1 TRINITY_DN3262_c0_g2~~TRINITY_DN3262_c0_g2_i2.p1  ORF type:complete len:858 (-),score=206.78 TRINITY_DN3262_c0_g2_i2:71-2584(-)